MRIWLTRRLRAVSDWWNSLDPQVQTDLYRVGIGINILLTAIILFGEVVYDFIRGSGIAPSE